MKSIRKIYQYSINYLSKHSGLATFLSHGGVHLIALVLLSILAIILYNKTDDNEKTNLTHVCIDAYEKSDSINFMLYFPQIIYGFINLDNKETNTFSFDIYFLREDLIVDDDLLIPDSALIKTKCSVFYDIVTNVGKIKPLSIKKNENDDYIKTNKYSPDGKSLIYKATSTQSMLDLKYLEIPFKFIINKESSNAPTSILYLELNVESPVSEIPNSMLLDKYLHLGSSLRIDYGHTADGTNDYKPFDIKYVFPEPDVVTPFYLEYSNSKSVQRILDNKGVYLIYEDVMARNKANRMSLQYSILIGAIIAFMLDIIVNLILKWRRLAKKTSQKR